MSAKNGDRSRFHRQRRTKLHNRTRIRELRKTLRRQEQKSESKRHDVIVLIQAGIKGSTYRID